MPFISTWHTDPLRGTSHLHKAMCAIHLGQGAPSKGKGSNHIPTTSLCLPLTYFQLPLPHYHVDCLYGGTLWPASLCCVHYIWGGSLQSWQVPVVFEVWSHSSSMAAWTMYWSCSGFPRWTPSTRGSPSSLAAQAPGCVVHMPLGCLCNTVEPQMPHLPPPFYKLPASLSIKLKLRFIN